MASKPEWAEQIARERIDLLFQEAEEQFPEHRGRSDRYVEIARNMAMKFNLSIPAEHREEFCSGCGAYLKPGNNARVRVDDGVKTVTCEECGGTERTAYSD